MYKRILIITWFFAAGLQSKFINCINLDSDKSSTVQKFAKDLRSFFELEKSNRILHIGCYDFDTKSNVSKKGQAAYDLQYCASEDLIDSVINQYGLSHKNKIDNCSVADSQVMNYLNEYDLVVSFSCFHWIEDQQKALNNIANSLKPGGTLLVLMLGKSNENAVLKSTDNPFFKSFIKVAYETKKWVLHFQDIDIDTQIFPQDPESFKTMLQNAGLEAIEINLIQRCKTFEDVASLANWLRHLVQDIPSIAELSTGIQDQFIEDVVAEYVMHVPIGSNGSIEYNVPALIIHAKKPY